MSSGVIVFAALFIVMYVLIPMFWFNWNHNSNDSLDVFLQLIRQFNKCDVRYVIVEELPSVESVYDRRCVYILLNGGKSCFDYYIYECITGDWCEVSDYTGLNEYLGRV